MRCADASMRLDTLAHACFLTRSGRRRVRADACYSCYLRYALASRTHRECHTHPSCSSVWAVTCLSNGDIAAGTSDGLVRVFSRADDRVASAEALSVCSSSFVIARRSS